MTIELARTKVLLNPDQFRPDFFAWLNANYHIYEAFEREADKIRLKGRDHYSHRRIWEFLRNDTVIRETSCEFKLNNNYTRDCALLYVMLHSEAKSFFRFRGGERNAECVGAAA